jgi:hypothetical protein
MVTKDMTNTGKVEKHGKLMRMRGMMVEGMMMGTPKVASGEINQVHQVHRRKRGTRGKIHRKDGVHRRLLL